MFSVYTQRLVRFRTAFAIFCVYSSSGWEQTVTEPTHIDGGVLDLVLADVPDVAGVQFGSPVGTSDHSAVFIDIVLEQLIPHLVGRQKVYLKNSVDWKLVTGDVKGLNSQL